MKEEKEKSLKEKLQEAMRKVTGQPKDSAAHKMHPAMKVGLFISGGIVLAWASQFVFSAFAGAIRGYKDFRRSIKNN